MEDIWFLLIIFIDSFWNHLKKTFPSLIRMRENKTGRKVAEAKRKKRRRIKNQKKQAKVEVETEKQFSYPSGSQNKG